MKNRTVSYTGFLILFGIFILQSFLMVYILFSWEPSFENKEGIEIVYDLDDDEKEVVKGWIRNIKPDYLETAERITFTNNKTLNVKNKSIFRRDDRKQVGRNYARGKDIYVLYTGFYYYDRDTLCHELLHNLVISMDDNLDEWFVEDLSEYDVCYKKQRGLVETLRRSYRG